jgi:hypothetical protein
MVFVVILYGVYWIWDVLMLRWLTVTAGQDSNIQEIRIGNRWVNKPSFFTSLLVLLLLSIHSLAPFRHRAEEVILDAFGPTIVKEMGDKKHELIELEEEMLVIGLVSFHLFVSALTYFFATSGQAADDANAKIDSAGLEVIFAEIREKLDRLEGEMRAPPV